MLSNRSVWRCDIWKFDNWMIEFRCHSLLGFRAASSFTYDRDITSDNRPDRSNLSASSFGPYLWRFSVHVLGTVETTATHRPFSRSHDSIRKTWRGALRVSEWRHRLITAPNGSVRVPLWFLAQVEREQDVTLESRSSAKRQTLCCSVSSNSSALMFFYVQWIWR